MSRTEVLKTLGCYALAIVALILLNLAIEDAKPVKPYGQITAEALEAQTKSKFFYHEVEQ